ncbi:helix-turn-helix transcriptional regulator [Nocardiopsis sp. CNT-189]|uniref:Scr1 family TA system antitoxin-like transcriptional regulator n=1 Tax=Nocardiopsis oceanisediminis TaxID=2816862 RepID=UPI003B2FC15E
MGEKVFDTWARWGRELERLRSLAGKNQGEVGAMVARSRQQIGKLEKATRTPSREDAQKLDSALATGGVLEALWVDITRVGAVPDEWKDFIALERQATEIREYQMTLIPGLLQTYGYASALMRRPGAPRRSAEQIERLAKNRVARLSALGDPPPDLWFALDEVVVTRILGSPEIMKDQLDHLIRLTEEGVIRLSLLPASAMMRPGLDGSFRVMTLPNARHVAHVDHLFGESLAQTVEEVNRCLNTFFDLVGEADSPGRSAERIKEIRKGLR